MPAIWWQACSGGERECDAALGGVGAQRGGSFVEWKPEGAHHKGAQAWPPNGLVHGPAGAS